MLNIVIGIIIALFVIIIVLPVMFINMHINLSKLENVNNPMSYNLDFEDIETTTSDGIKLKGWYIPKDDNKGTVLVCHGVAANRADVLKVSTYFHHGGYEVYTFDFRGHGDSDTAKVTYGFEEKKDIKAIVSFMITRGVEHVGAYGLSMGGAILMQSLSDNPEIEVMISDSGFASAEKIMKYRIGKLFPEPFNSFFAGLAKFYTKTFYHVNIDEIAPINVIDKIDRPILFIIGNKDTNIIPENGQMLYEKAKEPKELFVIKDVNHAQTINDPSFEPKIVSFMEEHLKQPTKTVQ